MSTGYAITINGVTHNQSEWCKIYRVDPSTVRSRMDRGMTFQEALVKRNPYSHIRRNPPERIGVKAKTTGYGYKAKRSAKCRKCYYSERADSQWVCMFIEIDPEHHRRGCEAGDKCTRFKPKGHRVTEAQEVFKAKTYGGGYV